MGGHVTSIGRPMDILLVQDGTGGAGETRKTLEQARLKSTLHVVSGGADAIAFLRHEDAYSTTPRPDLVVLDMDLSTHVGRRLVADIKTNGEFKSIPIVMLRSTGNEDDVRRYNLQSNLYTMTPSDLELFLGVKKTARNGKGSSLLNMMRN